MSNHSNNHEDADVDSGFFSIGSSSGNFHWGQCDEEEAAGELTEVNLHPFPKVASFHGVVEEFDELGKKGFSGLNDLGGKYLKKRDSDGFDDEDEDEGSMRSLSEDEANIQKSDVDGNLQQKAEKRNQRNARNQPENRSRRRHARNKKSPHADR